MPHLRAISQIGRPPMHHPHATILLHSPRPRNLAFAPARRPSRTNLPNEPIFSCKPKKSGSFPAARRTLLPPCRIGEGRSLAAAAVRPQTTPESGRTAAFPRIAWPQARDHTGALNAPMPASLAPGGLGGGQRGRPGCSPGACTRVARLGCYAASCRSK